MKIRAATHKDSAKIAQIWNHYIENTVATFNPVQKTEQDIANTLSQKRAANEPFLVLENDGIKGFATYGPFRNGEGYAKTKEHTVMLAPNTTGTGNGAALMNTLEKKAKELGVHSLFAGVSAENKGAITFHQKLGFTTVAELSDVGYKFGRWHNLILLQKML